jgi:hypothetical protein
MYNYFDNGEYGGNEYFLTRTPFDNASFMGCYGNVVEIDIGMRNVVLALWKNGFETCQCCSGHYHLFGVTESGFSAPWLSFRLNEKWHGLMQFMDFRGWVCEIDKSPDMWELNAAEYKDCITGRYGFINGRVKNSREPWSKGRKDLMPKFEADVMEYLTKL